MKKQGIFFIGIFLLFLINLSLAQEPLKNEPPGKEPEYAGEFFGVPVPIGNYFFAYSTVMVFGNRWGPHPRTQEAVQEVVWDQLLLSYEAFRRGITVSQYELEQEINKLLAADKVTFDYKSDKDAYQKWVKEKTNEKLELFENQVMHLLQIDKLRQEVMDSIRPQVTGEEAVQEYLNEHNTLSIELASFDEEKEANEFYRKARRSKKLWDEEKEKNPDKFKRPGFVSLEFLIDIWKLPQDAVYDMMKMKIGSIYRPHPIYKGYAVFKVLEKRRAEKAGYKKDKKLKEAYYNQITHRKKMHKFHLWFENLKKEAEIEIYDQKGAKNEKEDS